VGGQVDGGLGVGRSGGERGPVAELATNRLGAQLLDSTRAALRARQGSHGPLADEPLDQLAADEPRSAGYEHRLRHPDDVNRRFQPEP